MSTSTASATAKTSVSNQAVEEFAKKIGVVVYRQAPSWAWFLKHPDGQKKQIGKNNAAAWDALQLLAPKKPAKPKKLRFWSGTGVGVLRDNDSILRGTPEDVRVYACATSRAALVRMIHAYRQVERPSIEYRIKHHWSTEWDRAMAGIAGEVGIWVQYEPEAQPVRVV